jgi:hypothetical protein
MAFCLRSYEILGWACDPTCSAHHQLNDVYVQQKLILEIHQCFGNGEVL